MATAAKTQRTVEPTDKSCTDTASNQIFSMVMNLQVNKFWVNLIPHNNAFLITFRGQMDKFNGFRQSKKPLLGFLE